MSEYKSIRGTLSNPEVIEAVEELQYQYDVSQQEIIREAIWLLLEEEEYI